MNGERRKARVDILTSSVAKVSSPAMQTMRSAVFPSLQAHRHRRRAPF
jgi:hypothetical protein